MSFFDFARFINCSFEKADIQFSCFAGSILENTDFTNAELLINNFTGIVTQGGSFNDSDLYASRFIACNINNTPIQNCNIQKTSFIRNSYHAVSFKASNTREAYFDGDIPQ